MASSLYICYQSILEPLTSTQVVAYLEGLARAGYGIVLLTFEPRALTAEETRDWRARLKELGITWTWRRYHKWPTVPATAWDILAGVVAGLLLIRTHGITLVHARGHVPGLMAWILGKITGVRLLFDIRGFMAEEYVDGGVWPAGGVLFRTTKRVERVLVRDAAGIVVLTQKARALLAEWYPAEVEGKVIQVIPCCVDLRKYAAAAHGEAARKTIVYAGKLGGWYLTESMVAFMAAALKQMPELHWNVWTQSDPAPLRRAVAERGLDDRVSIGRTPADEMPAHLQAADAGLSFIKPCLSKLASSPTKVGEYLAAGLPVISTSGIGDMDDLLAGAQPVGMALRDFSPEALTAAVPSLRRIIGDPEMRARCRRTAEEQFDLQRVGWNRYHELYQALLGGPRE